MKKYIKASEYRKFRYTTDKGIPLAISNIVDDYYEFLDLVDYLVAGGITVDEFIGQFEQLIKIRFRSIRFVREAGNTFRFKLVDSFDNVEYLVIYR